MTLLRVSIKKYKLRVVMPIYLIRLIIILAALLINSQALAIETSIFSGQVVDLNKKPVEKAEIFLYNTENIRRPADFISATTDSSGQFRMPLPVGKYWAVARVRKGEKYGPLMPGDKHSGDPLVIEISINETTQETFTVVNLAESSRLNKKTSGEFYKIQGKIVNQQGDAVKPAYATANRNALSPQIADYLSAWTDEQGHYLLFLPTGTYYLGFAQTFPPTKSYELIKIITVSNHMEDVDIVVNKLTIRNRQLSTTPNEDHP
jgi:hypothetical protein